MEVPPHCVPVRSVNVRASYCSNTPKDGKRTQIEPHIDYDGLLATLKELLKPDETITEGKYTIKWIDDEGDACTISTKSELQEAIRLFVFSQEKELHIHMFPGEPEPGDFCAGESTKFYERMGARRWKKLYRCMGHAFAPRRFSLKVECRICSDLIWGIGRQGFKCVYCKTVLHKKCSKFIGSTISSVQECPGYPIDSPVLAYQTTKDDNSSTKGSITPANNHTEKTPLTGEKPIIGLDHFQLIAVIGRGSYAKVLMVKLKQTDKIYAMKVIKKSIIDDEEDIEWVQTEKHVFEQASNHPFLVGLHSCFQTPSRIFFVIEFVNGGDLMFHMQKMQRLEEDHARFYAGEISCALSYLHAKGIIYRDLKLDNVLLDSEGHIKLTDYGMCKEGNDEDGLTRTFCGTPNYIAPEVLKGQEYGYSVDWWALGVLLYEMLCGRSPFDITSATADNPDESENQLFQCILTKQIRIPRAISVRAGAVLKALLRRDPDERLGCDKAKGFRAIKEHPFFSLLDWERLEERAVTPPYVPTVHTEDDIQNFDNMFTEEAVQLTPDDPNELTHIDQSEFDGFEYVNPLLMNREDAV